MFSSIRSKLANYLRQKNRDRRTASRLRRLRVHDASSKNTRAIPEVIRQVLLISTSEGWGDSLYVAGLAQRLKENGIESVSVMTPESLLDHFDNPIFDDVWALEREIDASLTFSPDVTVDLTYMGVRCGKERLQLIKQLSCPVLTVSELCSKLNAYSGFISYREKAHISERMALVLGALTHHNEKRVMPAGFASTADQTRARETIRTLFPVKHPVRLAYLNTVARDTDRCFTQSQTDTMAQVLLKRGFDGIIVHAKVPCLTSNNRIRYLPAMTFHELTALIEQMTLVVTPDTSVTHLAAFYDIPTFVVFPPNDRDYWSEYAAKDAWGALSTHSVSFSCDDATLYIDPSGYASVSPRACSSYTPDILSEALDQFIKAQP